MNAVVEAKSMFRVVPRGVDQQKGEWLRVVGRLFGLTFSQAKKIEYLEIEDMRASRLDAMRAIFNELQERAEQRRGRANDIAIAIATYRSDGRSGALAGGISGARTQDRSEAAGTGSRLPTDRPAASALPRSGQ